MRSLFLMSVSLFLFITEASGQTDLSPPGLSHSYSRKHGTENPFRPDWAKSMRQGPNIPYRDPSSIQPDRRCSPSTRLDGSQKFCR
jgi:hypothetical protein